MNSMSTRLSLLVVGFSLLSGCGGSNSNSGTTTPPPTTPDLGIVAGMQDSVEYTITNVSSGAILGITGQSQTAGTALNLATSDAGADQLWHVMPMANSQYNVENMLTHQVIGISGASTAAGTAALQWADNGTPDHLWTFYLLTDGNYLICSWRTKPRVQVRQRWLIRMRGRQPEVAVHARSGRSWRIQLRLILHRRV
jgi:hypothetical protein